MNTSQEMKRLEVLLRALPAHDDTEASSWEKLHLRILHALSQPRWDAVLVYAMDALLADDRDGTLVAPLKERLRLVVDNDRGAAPEGQP